MNAPAFAKRPKSILARAGLACLAVLLVAALLVSLLFPTKALPLDNRSLTLSSSTANQTGVTYVVGFDIGTAGPLGSILVELCSNDPFPLTPCTPPPGLDLSGAILSDQTGEIDFSINSATANTILLGRPPAAAGTGSVSYTFDDITNPDLGSYFARYYTYATDDGTGAPTDYSGLAWVTNRAFSVTSQVPPNLEFCVAVNIPALDCLSATGSSLNFGNLSASSTAAATSQLLVYTNAGFGANVSLYGNTMTSGSYTIPALTTQSFSAPGNSQFGLNLRDNATPNIGSNPVGPGVAAIDANYDTPNLFRFVSGDTVISTVGTTDYRKFTTTYITNVSSSQRAGQYSTTISYICLANF